jgi:hypothetical protein
VLIFILLWLFFGVVSAIVGRGKGMGCSGFLGGCIFGPIGLLVVIFSAGNRKACPACHEKIHEDATVCPHCRSAVS